MLQERAVLLVIIIREHWHKVRQEQLLEQYVYHQYAALDDTQNHVAWADDLRVQTPRESLDADLGRRANTLVELWRILALCGGSAVSLQCTE